MAVTMAVCEQYPSTSAALGQVQLVFGTGRGGERWIRYTEYGEAGRQTSRCRWWNGRDRRAGAGGDVPHGAAHVLTPGSGHGKAWRYAARR